MTAEQFWANGFQYSDYLQLSQWQRFRDFRRSLQSGLELWRFSIEVRPFMLNTWAWGWNTSQNGENYSVGPVTIYWWW